MEDSALWTIFTKRHDNQATLNKATLAFVSASRVLRVWLSQLSKYIQEGLQRDELLEQAYSLKRESGYMCDFTLDIMRISLKGLDLTNTTRSAIWIKLCSGDSTSKNSYKLLAFYKEPFSPI